MRITKVQTLAIQAEGSTSNMSGAWSGVWSKLTSSVPNLGTLLTLVALALVAFAIIKYLMDRRRGGGGNAQHLAWTLVAAGVFAAPGLLFPLFLKLADGAINWGGSVLGG
ncbi:hypothetical protein ATK17_1732 [Branchiibius hedensis]|uniref:Uncharacterized protein n=2 Tax=Branchiibius TaxID=908251 RepID=A0A2Y9C1J1_9MICO|nr:MULTISPECIES: hypothetical protein [Branchiibius]KYH44815.1 hypothetical protein AZH51_12375 [Branchiibius sp. NY16-3462-2]PWJ25600.1 hypothetical protein ATK17_1732 [Branchiibius hedensis]SSA34413.1 hypothetical protein SAMN04489750_1732 [Branchiibius hedensis]